jgi:hypothetical protein
LSSGARVPLRSTCASTQTGDYFEFLKAGSPILPEPHHDNDVTSKLSRQNDWFRAFRNDDDRRLPYMTSDVLPSNPVAKLHPACETKALCT